MWTQKHIILKMKWAPCLGRAHGANKGSNRYIGCYLGGHIGHWMATSDISFLFASGLGLKSTHCYERMSFILVKFKSPLEHWYWYCNIDNIEALQWISGGWPAGCLHMSVDCQHRCIPSPSVLLPPLSPLLLLPLYLLLLLLSPCPKIPPLLSSSNSSYLASVHLWK